MIRRVLRNLQAARHSESVSRSPGDICSFFFLDQDHGWAIGEAGDFYLKDGKWWESQPCDAGGRENKGGEIAIGAPTYCPIAVWFADTRVGWLSNSNGYVGKSTDGGATWSDLVDLGAEGPNYCLPPALGKWYFFDAATACGLDSHGDLRTTYDGGANWTRIDLSLGLDDMHFLNHGKVFAGSKDALYRIALEATAPGPTAVASPN